MCINSVLISLMVILGAEGYAKVDVCGTTTLSATSELKTLAVTKDILSSAAPCVYTINGVAGKIVQINFPKLENDVGGKACDKPFVKLEGVTEGGVKSEIAALCATSDAATYHSPGSQLIVTIQGKTGTQGATLKAFNATYKSVSDEFCGPLVLETKEGQKTDWKIPQKALTADRNCTYKIQAVEGQKVQLNITALKFPKPTKTSKCSAPYLQLENFVEGGNTPIEDVCDTKLPHTISSTASAMIVTLHGVDKMEQHAVTATYTAAAANNLLIPFSSILLTALLCFLQS